MNNYGQIIYTSQCAMEFRLQFFYTCVFTINQTHAEFVKFSCTGLFIKVYLFLLVRGNNHELCCKYVFCVFTRNTEVLQANLIL